MEGEMKKDGFDRRDFLKSAVAGGAAAAAVSVPQSVSAQPTPAPSATASPGYAFLNPEEAAFVEAVVDHMVPADELTPKGTDIGLNIYIDRALAGGWGKGDRLYMQGPWKRGTPNQGYQLPLTPAQLYRAGIEATNAYCRKTYGKTFDPIYGGNRDKAGWKLIGFPGVVAVHRDNVEKYRGKKYTADILGIADMS